MPMLSAGDVAPGFELMTDLGIAFRLRDHLGRPVVVFFYPEDDTEGCTIENVEFTAEKRRFDRLGVALLGVSPQSVEAHCRFRDKHRLTVPLAADTDRQVIEAYGVWGPKRLYGRDYEGLHRTTFLIDAEGKIAQVWQVRRIKGHARTVLEAARRLMTATASG